MRHLKQMTVTVLSTYLPEQIRDPIKWGMCGRQCDQMDTLFLQYFVTGKIENWPNGMQILAMVGSQVLN